jgi:hypothetical protein
MERGTEKRQIGDGSKDSLSSTQILNVLFLIFRCDPNGATLCASHLFLFDMYFSTGLVKIPLFVEVAFNSIL